MAMTSQKPCILHMYLCYSLHVKIHSGDCVMCVFVFEACHQLTNSLVEEGGCFIQWGIMGKVGGQSCRNVSFICEPEHLCLSKGALSFNC